MNGPTVLLLLLLNSIAPFGHPFHRGNAIVVGGGGVGRRCVGVGAEATMISPRSSMPLTTTTTTTRMMTAADETEANTSTTMMTDPRLTDPRRIGMMTVVERRPFLRDVVVIPLLLSSSSLSSTSANAADDLPKVTHRVYMDVRISRADGSFYVRDSPPSAPSSSSTTAVVDEDPFYGTLVLGLFGDRTPNHVRQFLSYVDVPYDVDSPLPSYSRSKFNTLDASTGLLIGGTVSSFVLLFLRGNGRETIHRWMKSCRLPFHLFGRSVFVALVVRS
jgi:hypothetical protein